MATVDQWEDPNVSGTATPSQAEPRTLLGALRTTPTEVYVTTLIMFVAWTFVCMDTSFPGLALPAISSSIHVSVSDLSYALGGIAFIEFVVPLVGGWLLDRYGRRKMFSWSLIGTGVFSAPTAPVAALWQFAVVRCAVAGSPAIRRSPAGRRRQRQDRRADLVHDRAWRLRRRS